MTDQFEQEIEINPERLEAIQHACNIFADVSRFNPESAPRDENDTADITNEILRRNLDLADSVSYSVAWHAVRKRRDEAARREAELEAQHEARRQEIEDYKRPSSEDRSAVLAEMKSRQHQPPQSAPVDLSHLSQAEFDSIPDAELRRMLGSVRVEDRQGRGNGRTVKEERNALILADKVVNRAGVRKVKSIKVSPEELAAREERARAIAADQAERRRLEEQRRQK
jgi:hypothetical protein